MVKSKGDNLVPQNKRTKDEQREIAKKGGEASGIARRERKQWKDTLEILLDMPIKDADIDDLEGIKSLAGMKGRNLTAEQVILAQTVQKAMKGDMKAQEFIRDTIGQKPIDMKQIDANVDVTFDPSKVNKVKKAIDDNPEIFKELLRKTD